MSFRTSFKNRKLKEVTEQRNTISDSDQSFLDSQHVSEEDIARRRTKIVHMFNLYDKYLTTYFDFYKKSFLDELESINQNFSEVNYFVEARIKSRNGYRTKVLKKLDQGFTGKIYDIYGSKIVIESYLDEQGNEVTDEDLLIKKTMEIENFLEQRREVETSAGSCAVETVHTKDYIKNPKESGYRSFHLLRHFTFSDNISFYSEVQLKTRKMYDDEQYGEKFGHASAYKNIRETILEQAKNIADYVPIFLHLTLDQKNQKHDLTPLPFKKCFEKYFGAEFRLHKSKLKNEDSPKR